MTKRFANCAIVMVNSKFFEKLETLAKSDRLSKLIPLGPSSIRKSNDLDNLCKIMAFSFVNYNPGADIEEFVTAAMVDIAGRSEEEVGIMFDILSQSMDLLVEACGNNALRPYRDGSFVGRIGRTSIEIILVGLVRCIGNVRSKHEPLAFIKETIIAFWQSQEASKFSAAGLAGTDRVRFTIPLGEKLFSR